MKQKNKKAFTLIELLIVIAIIGILASIVLVSLNSARQKAKDTSALASVASVVPAVLMCIDANQALTAGAEGTAICGATGIDNWPAISANGSGWTWGARSSVPASGTWSIVAANGTKNITCDQTTSGCRKTGF